MTEKNQIQPTDKKKDNCGCGCIGITERDAKESKPAVKKLEK